MELDIHSLQTLSYPRFEDERGFFTFSPLPDDLWIQENLSGNHRQVLRGMHLQKGESAQTKLVRVLTGAVQDIVIDLRPESPEYLQVSSFYLSEADNLYLLVPKGFAHGFISLADSTLFQYKIDTSYAPDMESSINWKSPEIYPFFKQACQDHNLDPSQTLVSNKDTEALNLQDWLQKHKAI